MKYNLDTYRFYANEKTFSFIIRAKVRMKETVDPDALRRAVNTAIKRYPYFAVEVVLGDDGGYDLIPNGRDVVVLPTSSKLPQLGSEAANRHLLFVDTEGRDIFFNISHSLCGGRGIMPWIMTTIYQYVVEKHHVTPDAPGIRKPNSSLLPGEGEAPTIDMLLDEEPIYQYKSKNPVTMVFDYLNGMFNPFMRKPIYYQFTFNQNDVMLFAKENDASVASFFIVAVAKALDKLLPEKHKVIGAEIAHNPSKDIGMPNTHCDILSHVHIDYERELLKKDMEMLGTITRSQIILQIDPSVSNYQLRQRFSFYDDLDRVTGLKNKREYYAKNDPRAGKKAQHGTFIVNYSGMMDWGEVADYVESYILIVEGHILLEVTSMADKIFVSFMQLIKKTKYVKAFGEVMDDLGIPYKIEGPYPKNMVKHKLPKQS